MKRIETIRHRNVDLTNQSNRCLAIIDLARPDYAIAQVACFVKLADLQTYWQLHLYAWIMDALSLDGNGVPTALAPYQAAIWSDASKSWTTAGQTVLAVTWVAETAGAVIHGGNGRGLALAGRYLVVYRDYVAVSGTGDFALHVYAEPNMGEQERWPVDGAEETRPTPSGSEDARGATSGTEPARAVASGSERARIATSGNEIIRAGLSSLALTSFTFTAIGRASVTIGYTVNKPVACTVYYKKMTDPAYSSLAFSGLHSTHLHSIGGLLSGTSYTMYLEVTDGGGTLVYPTPPTLIHFTTATSGGPGTWFES